LGETATNDYDFVFAENGVVCFKDGAVFGEPNSMKKLLNESRYQGLIDFLKKYIQDLNIPVKTGNFVEERTGMVNASPIGRSCTQQQRDEFFEYDKVHKIRETMIKTLEQKFDDWNLKFSIGGQISIDIFPRGWDKTYCLRYLKSFKNIYFFGDKTESGGNDYEIFMSPIVSGKSVKNPEDTQKFIHDMFL